MGRVVRRFARKKNTNSLVGEDVIQPAQRDKARARARVSGGAQTDEPDAPHVVPLVVPQAIDALPLQHQHPVLVVVHLVAVQVLPRFEVHDVDVEVVLFGEREKLAQTEDFGRARVEHRLLVHVPDDDLRRLPKPVAQGVRAVHLLEHENHRLLAARRFERMHDSRRKERVFVFARSEVEPRGAYRTARSLVTPVDLAMDEKDEALDAG